MSDALTRIETAIKKLERLAGRCIMSENPFAERPPFKKRVITVSLTREQDEAFERLKARTRTVTDGAMIKKALEHFVDHMSPEQGDAS